MEKKEKLFLIGFLAIIFLGQFFIADRVIFGDDNIFSSLAKENQFFFTRNAHPPLPVWVDIFFTEIFPLTNRTIRLTSILFATLTVGLVYIAGRRFFDKKVAFFASLLTGLSAWHIRASQMNSSSDGGMFTFFFLLTMYLFLLAMEKKQMKYFVYTGLAFGVTMFCKESGIVLIPVAGLYYLIQQSSLFGKDKKEFFKMLGKHLVVIAFFAGLVFSIFPGLDIVFNEGQSVDAILNRVDQAVAETPDPFSYGFMLLLPFSIFKLLIWMGPLFVFLPLLWLFQKDHSFSFKKKCGNLFFLSIFFILLFYLFAIPPTLDKTRYLLVLIPALALLCGAYLKTLDFSFKQWCVAFGVGVLFFFFFLFLNTDLVFASYEAVDNPLSKVMHFDTNFSVPLFTETDNSGFVMHFKIFLITYILSTLAFLVLLFSESFGWGFFKKYVPLALILLLGVGIGFNIFIVEEYALHWTSPNYSDAIKDLVSYAQENELKEPLYLLKNYELVFYLDDDYTQFESKYGLSMTNPALIQEFKEVLSLNGGTVIFTDMPFVARDGALWEAITSCQEDFVVSDKGKDIGYVFTC